VGGVNIYAYAGGSPTDSIDPSGNYIESAFDVGFIVYDAAALLRDGRCNLGTNLAALGADVLGLALPGVTGLGAGVRAIKFGQPSVKSVFAHGPHAGRTIGEVAQGLRAGKISPNTLPIDYVVRNGEAVTLNNRSLLALRRAGVEPTATRNLTGNARAESLLNSHLGSGVPSSVIRVRGGQSGSSLIE
jgi:hypothetical protein